MPLHYIVGYIALIVVPLGVAAAVLIVGRKHNIPMWANLAIAAIGMLLCLVLGIAVIPRCTDSYDVIRATRMLLTPEERKSLQGSGFFCPDVYLFQRDGKETCLVPDGDGGASVGCG